MLCLGSPIRGSVDIILLPSGGRFEVDILYTSELVGGESQVTRGVHLDVQDLLRVRLELTVDQLVLKLTLDWVFRLPWW